MTIEIAKPEDLSGIRCYDRHIPEERLKSCIDAEQVLVLKENECIRGILRWSLFWQTIPFVDLIFLDFSIHGQGLGTQLMRFWEEMMEKVGYTYVMTSTQADETAWQFYEKIGYRKIGAFLPPDQEASELIYGRDLRADYAFG